MEEPVVFKEPINPGENRQAQECVLPEADRGKDWIKDQRPQHHLSRSLRCQKPNGKCKHAKSNSRPDEKTYVVRKTRSREIKQCVKRGVAKGFKTTPVPANEIALIFGQIAVIVHLRLPAIADQVCGSIKCEGVA